MESFIQLDGNTLSPAEVYAVASENIEIKLSEDSWNRIVKSRKVVDDILDSGEVVYGINTGFGSLVDTIISNEHLQDLQVNLIRSHATGLGDAMSKPAVKAMMVARINSFARGFSGVHPNVVQQLIDYVNHDVTPYIPRIGSLGASGDLAPLSHMALALIGEGFVIGDDEEKIPTNDLLLDRGLIPVELSAKDGLSLINGTSQMLSYSILSLQILNNLLTISDVIYCTSLEAYQGAATPADARVHAARPHPGQILISTRIRQIMQGSEILAGHKDCSKVQDPYSFRCAPQVHGAVYEALIGMRETIQIELNSTTDNPLVFPETTEHQSTIISQGNFHGEILALCADRMSLALFELGSISERRMDQLLDSKKSGLPPFLATHSGLESGMMIVQYSAGSALAEMHGHAAPRTSFSTSTSAGQEDHVSMGANAATKLFRVIDNCFTIAGIELFISSQAIEYRRPQKSSNVLEDILVDLRKVVPIVKEDLLMASLQRKAKKFVEENL